METEFLYSDWNAYQDTQDKDSLLGHLIFCGDNCLIVLFHKLIKHVLRVLYLKFYMWNFKISLIENQT